MKVIGDWLSWASGWPGRLAFCLSAAGILGANEQMGLGLRLAAEVLFRLWLAFWAPTNRWALGCVKRLAFCLLHPLPQPLHRDFSVFGDGSWWRLGSWIGVLLRCWAELAEGSKYRDFSVVLGRK